MTELNERFYTPNDLAEKGIMSKTKQWQERENGSLKCFRVGKKVLYTDKHLQDYFDLSTNATATTTAENSEKGGDEND